MKSFFKDYSKLCKESCVFLKKHWLGSFIVVPVIVGGMYTSYRYYRMKKADKQFKELAKELEKEEL